MKSDLSIAIFCRYCNGLSSRYVKFLLDIEETAVIPPQRFPFYQKRRLLKATSSLLIGTTAIYSTFALSDAINFPVIVIWNGVPLISRR